MCLSVSSSVIWDSDGTHFIKAVVSWGSNELIRTAQNTVTCSVVVRLLLSLSGTSLGMVACSCSELLYLCSCSSLWLSDGLLLWTRNCPVFTTETISTSQDACDYNKKWTIWKKKMLNSRCDPENRLSGSWVIFFFFIYVCWVYKLDLFILLACLLNKERDWWVWSSGIVRIKLYNQVFCKGPLSLSSFSNFN